MLPTKVIDQIGISIGDEYVELKYGEWVFKLGLDQNGYPDFPESVKKELPLNIPQTVISAMATMRADGRKQAQIELEILRCDPVLCDPDEPKLGQWYEGSWGALTCAVCHESSNGRTGSDRVTYNYHTLFEKHWVYKDNEEDNDITFYWAFSNKTLICEECLRNIMSETGITFPNGIDCAYSPDRPQKRVLH
jgi:hypothetical protein